MLPITPPTYGPRLPTEILVLAFTLYAVVAITNNKALGLGGAPSRI